MSMNFKSEYNPIQGDLVCLIQFNRNSCHILYRFYILNEQGFCFFLKGQCVFHFLHTCEFFQK
jgi:hypothetical protein